MEAHEILGISKYASEDQIRAAYKALAMKWHPDRQLNNSEEATAKFAEINKANRTMLRNLRRARRAAQAGQTPSASECSAPPSPQSATTSLSESSTCYSASQSRASSPAQRSLELPSSSSATLDPFSSPRSSSSDLRHTRGGDQSPKSVRHPAADTLNSHASPKSFLYPLSTDPLRNKIRKSSKSKNPDLELNACEDEDNQPLLHHGGRDVKTLRPGRVALHGTGAEVPRTWTHTLHMSLEDIYRGKTFHFRVVRYTRSGRKHVLPVSVRVPSGSRGGTEVIVQGAGNECKDGSWQDLSFIVKETKHEKFKRVHNDLILEIRLPWVESLNSQEGQVYLQGIDEKDYLFKVDYHITRLLSGTAVIPGAGMPCRDGGGRGRIIVRSMADLPKFFLLGYDKECPSVFK
ncbi:Chaperone protein DnaJ [Psilocybe cubensis]|uniref:J domain-containing protein n=2 Tax=Psilocybe cubensis TaxID=181762 RepID=A0A8H7Y2I9_PSICU|nr:Chaperone protein DnaJ [Psilocybe cubensis]KAH9481269.1 Chaperone protein DnaJ [Psilocybe cubensis]